MLNRSSSRIIRSLCAFVVMSVLGLNTYSFSFATNQNLEFEVNVEDSLSVEISDLTDDSQKIGNVDSFLRNHIHLDVSSNNSNGFTATMSTLSVVPNLVHSAKSSVVIPTLNTSGSATAGEFPANYWGYSVDDTTEGITSAQYDAMVGINDTPIALLSSADAATGTKDVYFGTKAGVTQAAGTYNGVVVINIVGGVSYEEPSNTPTNPVEPSNVTPSNSAPSAAPKSIASNLNNSSPSNINSGSGTSSIMNGDSDAGGSYAAPQGVVEEYVASDINTGNSFATSLAVSSVVAAATGTGFFILAKRRKKDENEEEF